MDKNAIKKYAVWARTELKDRVRQRAARYEVTVDANPNADSASGKVLTDIEKTQRQAAIAHMRDKGYEYVIEEVAYTWFNRFAALRYMEVNNYLPSRVRVFTDENGNFKPQILTEAIHLDLDGLDMEKVFALKEADDNDELYKYLLITQCNALSVILPQMFKPVDEKCKLEKYDYTILLFPDNLLRDGSVVEQMVSTITEDNWLDAVQIIGWLYQYYNIEPKDNVFADLKKNIKITKENIPAATQLFTPDWIVRYMVENSLGHLWLEKLQATEQGYKYTYNDDGSNKNSYVVTQRSIDSLKQNWKYYLDEAEQEPDVAAQLAKIREEYKTIKPEDIKVIDPCMGSGHILVYAFDVLMQIYMAQGYVERDAVKSI
ncbi:MAG: SAM-dependent methyltransferase, partial [Lachnospiraceae bacterium]